MWSSSSRFSAAGRKYIIYCGVLKAKRSIFFLLPLPLIQLPTHERHLLVRETSTWSLMSFWDSKGGQMDPIQGNRGHLHAGKGVPCFGLPKRGAWKCLTLSSIAIKGSGSLEMKNLFL